MIGLTRTDGERCRLDPDMVQRVEGHPATIVYLPDGAKYAVLETVDEVVRVVRDHHAAVVATAYRVLSGPDGGVVVDPGPPAGTSRPPVAPVPREV
jgi:flagellar protein FlbD